MGTREHAFVVGGGPAGLVAAIALYRKGLQVTVADGGDLPSDKACGEGILPEGLAALKRLGIALDWTEGRAFHGIRFVNERSSAEAVFESRAGIGMRRITLHRQLIRAAEQAGVSILRKTPVNGISNGRVSVGTDSFAADWIVGADGFRSQVRRWSKLSEKKSAPVRYAFRQHFACEPWTNFVEVHWAAKAQLYITPVSSHEVGVVVLTRNPKLRLQEALAFFPIVRERLKNCEVTTAERGAATENLSLPAVCSGNIALVGDASGTVDAITGEGMSLAFRQAEALAEAISRRDLSIYAAAHSRLRRRPIWMARLLLTLQGQPKLQERVLQIFAAEPELFQRMLAVHLGHESTFSLAAAGARLGLLLLASNFS
jgi:flavin-dependent dehydrogenase